MVKKYLLRYLCKIPVSKTKTFTINLRLQFLILEKSQDTTSLYEVWPPGPHEEPSRTVRKTDKGLKVKL